MAQPNSPSLFLARLMGPTAIAFAATEFKNSDILPSPDPAVTYLNGAILFISGLSVILHHNCWSRGWTVLITILGWLMVTVGLWRMAQPTAQPDGNEGVVWATEGVLFVAGMVLCWRGYVHSS